MAIIKPYVDQLLDDRDTLADNISEKGVEVEEDETITSLAQKVSLIPTSGETLVDDVQVDNVSVVVDKIANIPLTENVRNIRPATADVLDDPIEVNTIYTIGEVPSFYAELPEGQVGDFIEMQFITGSTVPTIQIVSDYPMTDLDLTPEVNTIYNIYGEWGLIGVENYSEVYGWFLTYAEAPVVNE